jgi:hypothetical protein
MTQDLRIPEPSWRRIAAGNLSATTVSARPTGLWTLVYDFVAGSQWLKITANPLGLWSYADSGRARCGPDGDPQAMLSPAVCLCKNAPVGALIAKIGGSTAGADDGPVFAVGTSCVLRVPDGGGPLYLTINDERAGMENNAGSLEITSIAFAPVAAAAAPAPVVHPSRLCAVVAWLAKAAGCSKSAT